LRPPGRAAGRVRPSSATTRTAHIGTSTNVDTHAVVAATGWHESGSASAVAGVLWLAVVATVIAYGPLYAGLRSTPGSVAMIVTLLEPVTAVVLAAVLLGEALTAATALGGALLLGAVALLYLAPLRR